MSKSQYKRKIVEQRFLAIGIILVCVIALWVASTGTSIEDRDCTAVLLILPLGLYTLFTRKVVIV